MPAPAWLNTWKQKARALKVQTLSLYFAVHDPRTPWSARILAGAVVAYAFSPIDLIPDFIPVLGYLDDLLLLPLGVWLALRLIPSEVMADSRVKAEAQLRQGKPVYKWMAVIFVLVWLAALGLVCFWLYKTFWL
jgi:uncharacterized membrane protein YkvA (DUF1232 family)